MSSTSRRGSQWTDRSVHPDDVADFVALQVAQVAARAPSVGVDPKAVTLEGRTALFVELDARVWTKEKVSLPSGLLLPDGRGIATTRTIPIIGQSSAERVVLHVGCDDFDGKPPTAELLGADRVALPSDRWPSDTNDRGIVPTHPKYGRPFFCRPGLREFHEHPQHEDEPWDRYREGFTLHGVVLGLLHDLRTRWYLR
jgi:hypothetical protein